MLNLFCWCHFFQVRSIRFFGGFWLGSRAKRRTNTTMHVWSMLAGRIRNPTPGKLFYCQDQVGEEPRVGLKAAGDFSLGKDVLWRDRRCFFWGGHECTQRRWKRRTKNCIFLVDFGNIPCPDPVLRLRARGKVKDPCFCNEAYVHNKSGKNTPWN